MNSNVTQTGKRENDEDYKKQRDRLFELRKKRSSY